MAEALVIQLGTGDGEVDWLVVDTGGGRVGSVQRGTLLEAAAQVGQRRVIGIVPATEVLLTDANVPIRNVTRLRQALPFALEEQVADDVSDLHFSIGKRGGNGALPVAVVRRDRLEQIESELDEVLGLLRRGHAPELTDEQWPMRLTSCLTACQRHFEQRIRVGEELATNFELTRAQWDRLLAARSALRDLASVSDAPVR